MLPSSVSSVCPGKREQVLVLQRYNLTIHKKKFWANNIFYIATSTYKEGHQMIKKNHPVKITIRKMNYIGRDYHWNYLNVVDRVRCDVAMAGNLLLLHAC